MRRGSVRAGVFRDSAWVYGQNAAEFRERHLSRDVYPRKAWCYVLNCTTQSQPRETQAVSAVLQRRSLPCAGKQKPFGPWYLVTSTADMAYSSREIPVKTQHVLMVLACFLSCSVLSSICRAVPCRDEDNEDDWQRDARMSLVCL